MVQMAGNPAAISEAKVGPDKAATRGSPQTSVMISLTRLPEEMSRPLLMLRTGTPGAGNFASVSRTCCVGQRDEDVVGFRPGPRGIGMPDEDRLVVEPTDDFRDGTAPRAAAQDENVHDASFFEPKVIFDSVPASKRWMLDLCR